MAHVHAAKRAHVVTLLVAGHNVRDAASRAGVSERTVWNWLQDSDFRTELRTQETQLFDAAGRALLDAATGSVDVLRNVAGDEAQPGAVRVRAASELLATMLRVVELRTLAARVERLERMLDDN